MREISRFSLEAHSGPYETWPLKSRLLVDGNATGTSIAGCSLLHQFEVADGYFLVHDWDCPFEERTHFTLLDRNLRVLSSRGVGVPYSSWLLTGFDVIDERHFIAVFGADRWDVKIRPSAVRYLYPRIALRRMRGVEGS